MHPIKGCGLTVRSHLKDGRLHYIFLFLKAASAFFMLFLFLMPDVIPNLISLESDCRNRITTGPRPLFAEIHANSISGNVQFRLKKTPAYHTIRGANLNIYWSRLNFPVSSRLKSYNNYSYNLARGHLLPWRVYNSPKSRSHLNSLSGDYFSPATTSAILSMWSLILRYDVSISV